MIHILEIGISKGAVTLCDRGHATLPESVFYTGNGPFGKPFLSGVRYTNAPMFENAKDANGFVRHSSLRGSCVKGMI
jgi:hypothetical protein